MHFSDALSYAGESMMEEDCQEHCQYINELMKQILNTDDVVPALMKLLKETTD